MTPTYAGIDKYGEQTYGGYSSHIVVTEHFVVSIPEDIGLDAAAPCCAPALQPTRRNCHYVNCDGQYRD